MNLPIPSELRVKYPTKRRYCWYVLPDNAYPSFCQIFSDHLGDFYLVEYVIMPIGSRYEIWCYGYEMTKDGWEWCNSRKLAETDEYQYELFWIQKAENYKGA